MEHIWIIGGSSGIGKAVAAIYCQQGHRVAISGTNLESVSLIADNLGAEGLVCDVCRPEDIQNAKNRLLEKWSHIDRILCFAGVYEPMRLDAMDMDKVQHIINVNLIGCLRVMHEALAYFNTINKGKKQLAITASVAGYTGLPNSQPYGATKAALINTLESLHAEAKHLDIKLINPGFVHTKLTAKNTFPMPFVLTPEQAAQAIVRGLDKRSFEINFPKTLTYPLKFLSVLPYALKQRLVGRLVGRFDKPS